MCLNPRDSCCCTTEILKPARVNRPYASKRVRDCPLRDMLVMFSSFLQGTGRSGLNWSVRVGIEQLILKLILKICQMIVSLSSRGVKGYHQPDPLTIANSISLVETRSLNIHQLKFMEVTVPQIFQVLDCIWRPGRPPYLLQMEL